jgi:hypothetical protein
MSDVSSNPLQLIEQTEMKPLIEGCVKKALLSYCKGTPAKIPWPHRVLHDAVRRIEELESEIAAAKAELTRAREALIKRWADELFFARPLCTMARARELAQERYTREIAQSHKGEEG